MHEKGLRSLLLLSNLIFWIPVSILLVILCVFLKWTREKMLLAFCSLPSLFFVFQIFIHPPHSSPQSFVWKLIGLSISILLFLGALIHLVKK
ncbi:hypothetical protein D920_02106 [Enterococcus faecalis 13-SD-W-01]|nr:hypothetical protein D920_02106 [Enterococcus faecalis 13-SD-W-01]